jgi:4-hydroxybenzoyl-CoA thioesterase
MLITRRSIEIEWGDCDPADIVYFPNYFGWFDTGLMHHFASVGLPKKELLKRYGLNGWPLIDMKARFMKPSTYGETVVVETKIAQFGRTSFDIEYRLLRGEETAIECQEKRVLVARDPETGKLKPFPIPDEVKALFA